MPTHASTHTIVRRLTLKNCVFLPEPQPTVGDYLTTTLTTTVAM